MEDKERILLDINEIKEKIKEIKSIILEKEKTLDEINSDEIE
jgi:tetrahydromethanopterin S-methyltransferase subunit B